MSPAPESPRRLYPWECPDEIVQVETPEQIVVEYRIAPFGARILAAFIDQLIVYGSLFVIVVLLLFSFGASRDVGGDMPWYLLVVFLLVAFLLQVFYFAWFEARREGQTPGKRRIGLRAVMADGRGITVGAALVRNLARILDNTVLLWLIPILDRRRRRIGDFLAGTLVVRTGEEQQSEFRYNPDQPEYDPDRREFFFSAGIANQLYVDDLNLIEHFFSRLRSGMGRRRRRELVIGLARRYRERLGLDEQSERIEDDPYRFLFELYLLLKDRFEKEVY